MWCHAVAAPAVGLSVAGDGQLRLKARAVQVAHRGRGQDLFNDELHPALEQGVLGGGGGAAGDAGGVRTGRNVAALLLARIGGVEFARRQVGRAPVFDDITVVVLLPISAHRAVPARVGEQRRLEPAMPGHVVRKRHLTLARIDACAQLDRPGRDGGLNGVFAHLRGGGRGRRRGGEGGDGGGQGQGDGEAPHPLVL